MSVKEKIKDYADKLGVPFRALHMQMNSVYGNGRMLSYEEQFALLDKLIQEKFN